MAVYGYARVSTVQQNEGRQLATLYNSYGIDKDHIYVDKCSGKNTDRPALKEMLDTLQSGDKVVVSELSRLGRNTMDLLELTDQLITKQVDVVFDKEKIDSSTSTGRLMLTVIAAIAEFEREMILERQREGIDLAKQEGKYKGRKPVVFDPSLVEMVCEQYMDRKITVSKACELLKYKTAAGIERSISAPSFYKILEKYMDENKIKRYEYVRNVDSEENQ